MRKVLLAILTLAVLGAAFYMLIRMQSVVPVAQRQTTPSPATRPSDEVLQYGSLGATQNAWIRVFNEKTGQPQVQFRAEHYVPTEGNQVKVDHPEAIFYVGARHDQLIHLEGKTGNVIMPGQGIRLRSNLTPTPTQPPSRGQMRDVTITCYQNQAAMDRHAPQLTITLNNAYFDNETLEIATQEYIDDQGAKIAGRDVPIHARGDMFDFDGKGFYARWDDRTHSLKTLTIYQSDRLAIKKAPESAPKPQASAANPAPAKPAGNGKGKTAQASALDPASIYRATFHDNVLVMQAKEQLAAAQTMFIDFASSTTGTGDNSKPAEQTEAKPATPAVPTTNSSMDRSLLAKGEPIIVTWKGELTVANAPQEKIEPETTDDAIICLVGQPVILQSEGHRVEAATAFYHLNPRTAYLYGVKERPVRMSDANGSELLTPQLEFDQNTGIAILRGPSSANVLVQQEGKQDKLHADWQEIAQATFINAGKSPVISKLLLQGNVNIQHPSIQRFKAGFLSMDFVTDQKVATSKEKAAMPPLQQLIAQKGVDTILTDRDKQLAVRAQNLKLQMAQATDKTLYPSHFEADGGVVLADESKHQQIAADAIQANLAPKVDTKADPKAKVSAAPMQDLKDMVATGHVHMKSADGQSVDGQRVEVRTLEGTNKWIVVEGTATEPATLAKDNSLIAGRLIEVNMSTNQAVITGGGRLAMVPSDSANTKDVANAKPSANATPGQPIEVTWTGDAKVDGNKNTAAILGNVHVHYTDTEGAVNDAWGDRVDMVLAATPESTTKPASRSDVSFLSNRYVQQLTLLPEQGKEIQIQSLKMAGSFIDRQVNLFGPRLDCQFSPDRQLQTMVIPAASQDKPGRMLYVQMPPASKTAVKTNDPFASTGLNGATAFAWHDRLAYDRSKNQIAMLGSVVIRHKPETTQGQPFDLSADSAIVELTPPNTTPKDAKTAPAKGASLGLAPVDRITLTGRPAVLHAQSLKPADASLGDKGEILLTTPTIEVYPRTHDVIAVGTQRNPVQIEKGNYTGDCTKAYINTVTQDIHFMDLRATARR